MINKSSNYKQIGDSQATNCKAKLSKQILTTIAQTKETGTLQMSIKMSLIVSLKLMLATTLSGIPDPGKDFNPQMKILPPVSYLSI